MRFLDSVREEQLDEGLRSDLRLAETFSRREFLITSGYRRDDERCHGMKKAVDIRCEDSNDRMRIVRGLIQAGFERIGLYSAHVHADVCEKGFPREVLWLGGASK